MLVSLYIKQNGAAFRRLIWQLNKALLVQNILTITAPPGRVLNLPVTLPASNLPVIYR